MRFDLDWLGGVGWNGARLAGWGLGLALGIGPEPLSAAPLAIPNGSFEEPVVSFVDIHIDAWQESPRPEWYIDDPPFTWETLTGLFQNTPPGDADHIDNLDGDQAMYMFAVPQAGLSLDYSAVDWTGQPVASAFDARFEVGKSYRLTVGLLGGGPIVEGATMELRLYALDSETNRIPVAATAITYSSNVFSNTPHLIDFHVEVPTVRAGDAWADQPVGIQFLSTVPLTDTNLWQGYWDLDNVRLASFQDPVLSGIHQTEGQFGFTLLSEPGLRFEILATDDATAPLSNWTSVGTVTNVSGEVMFMDSTTASNRRFYQAQQLSEP